MNKDRLKFRAWDRKNKTMYELADIDSEHACCLNAYNINGSKYEGDEPDEDLIPMQCTGLKDKKGNLIFEGDIVKYFFPDNSGKSRGHIYWDTQLMTFMVQDIDCDEEELSMCGSCEIIGNIYENSKLL